MGSIFTNFSVNWEKYNEIYNKKPWYYKPGSIVYITDWDAYVYHYENGKRAIKHKNYSTIPSNVSSVYEMEGIQGLLPGIYTHEENDKISLYYYNGTKFELISAGSGEGGSIELKTDETLSILDDGTLVVNKDVVNEPISILVEQKVPKVLSILEQVVEAEIDTTSEREEARLYVDLNGNSKQISLEQIKQLSTKLICVNELGTSEENKLSDGDFILPLVEE